MPAATVTMFCCEVHNHPQLEPNTTRTCTQLHQTHLQLYRWCAHQNSPHTLQAPYMHSRHTITPSSGALVHTNHPRHFYSVGTKVPVCVCVCDWYKKCLGWFVCTKAPELGVIVCLLCMYGAWSVCGLFWCAHHLYSCRCVWWSCVQVRVVFGSSCGWLWTSQQNIVSLVVGYWTLHGLFVNWMCSQFLSLALSFPSSILLLHSLTLPPSHPP